jgi:hypothetical protein
MLVVGEGIGLRGKLILGGCRVSNGWESGLRERHDDDLRLLGREVGCL